MQFSDEVIKIIDNLCEKFGMAIDWTSQNVIPYLQEVSQKIVNYEIGTSVVWLVVGLIALIIGIMSVNKMNKTDDDGVAIACFITMLFLIPTGIIIIITQTLDIVTSFTLPEKIIYDQISNIYSQIK